MSRLKYFFKKNQEQFLVNIKSLLRELYEEFSFIKNSLSPSEQDEFDKIWFKKDDGEYENALKNLTTYLYKTLTYSLPFFIKKFLYPLSYSIIKYFSS